MNPSEREELLTLEADLRRALQHQLAEYERMRELQLEMEALLRRARELTGKPDATPQGDAATAEPRP